MAEYIAILVLLIAAMFYLVWELRRHQAYHLKRVLEMLEEKHKVEKEVDDLRRDNVALELDILRRDRTIQRLIQRNLGLQESLDSSQRDFQKLLEEFERQQPIEGPTLEGSPRLWLATEED